jgi:hypothetical protein
VVTPTFAAGLGVLVAAVLAYQMGMPSFRVSMPRWNGQRCANAGCARAPGPAGPGSASVKGGQRLSDPASAAAAGASSERSASAGKAAGLARPVVSYRTLGSESGSFLGHLTIRFRGGAPAHWRLRFSYSQARIERVWGHVQWRLRNQHTAVVTGTGAAGASAAGQEVKLWFDATGSASAPDACVVNRVACHIR